jgi:signal transduction histidine kinase
MNATDIYDSTFTIEKQETINKLLVKFETEKKENEIILKNKKLALEKAKSSRRNIIIYSLAVFIVLVIIIGVFVLQNIRNKNKLISKEVELKNQEINKILKDQEIKSYAALLEGQEKERQRIAADLHDRLGGLLSTIKSYFSVIEDKISELEEKTVKQHKTASGLLNTAVEEVRNISHNLHSGVLKNFGLLLALEDLKNTLELSGSLNIDLNIDGKKQDISTPQEIEIYRIIQELFSNTMKHAKAEQVTLQIVFEEKQIIIIFEDDGLGFDVGTITKGIGLKNIEARTKKLHGNLNIDSRIGRGTIVIIEIPII